MAGVRSSSSSRIFRRFHPRDKILLFVLLCIIGHDICWRFSSLFINNRRVDVDYYAPPDDSSEITIIAHNNNNTSNNYNHNNNSTSDITTTTATTTKNNNYTLCFVTSVFASNVTNADIVSNVTSLKQANPDFHFLLFTNLETIHAPGWSPVVIQDLQEKFHTNLTNIIQSRWPKFLPWQHRPTLEICPIIFYMDGFTIPKNTPDVATLVFTVVDDDVVGDDKIAAAAIPISCLRQGYRSIQLYDYHSNTRHGPFQYATLLVEIKF